MILVILAAGRGKRLGSMTQNLPKCLINLKKKNLIDYNLPFIKKFKKTVIITGYKSNLIEKKFKLFKSIKIIKNNFFSKTNMVYSLFKSTKYIKKTKKNVVVIYSDIIFDKSIFNLLKENQSFIVIYKDWLKIWKLRNNNNLQKIKSDAEDIVLKKDNLISIGGKIKNSLPTYQYMGILKFRYKDFIKINDYFKTLKNKKIDFTSFINLVLKKKIVKIKVKKTNKFWLEIDNQKDLRAANKLIKYRNFLSKNYQPF